MPDKYKFIRLAGFEFDVNHTIEANSLDEAKHKYMEYLDELFGEQQDVFFSNTLVQTLDGKTEECGDYHP